MNLKDSKQEVYMGRLEEKKGKEKLWNYNLKTYFGSVPPAIHFYISPSLVHSATLYSLLSIQCTLFCYQCGSLKRKEEKMLSILPSSLSINLLWYVKLHSEEPTSRQGEDITNHPFDNTQMYKELKQLNCKKMN